MSSHLRRLRKAYRISQQKLAEASGVDQSNISNIERTQRLPNVHIAMRLARALSKLTGKQVLVDDIFPLEDEDGGQPRPGGTPK